MPPARRRTFKQPARMAAEQADLDEAIDSLLTSPTSLKLAPAVEARKQKQARIVTDFAFYRKLLKLCPNLAINAHQLKKSLRTVVAKKPFAASLGDLNEWVGKHAAGLKANLCFIQKAIAKSPQPLWVKPLFEPTPIASLFGKHAGASSSSQPAQPPAEDAGDESAAAAPPPESSQPVSVDSSPPDGTPPRVQAFEQPQGTSVPVAQATEVQYVFGWSHQFGKAWRAKIKPDGTFGEKDMSRKLGYQTPFDPSNASEHIWGCWPEEEDYEILDMPIPVYCARYNWAWIKELEGIPFDKGTPEGDDPRPGPPFAAAGSQAPQKAEPSSAASVSQASQKAAPPVAPPARLKPSSKSKLAKRAMPDTRLDKATTKGVISCTSCSRNNSGGLTSGS